MHTSKLSAANFGIACVILFTCFLTFVPFGLRAQDSTSGGTLTIKVGSFESNEGQALVLVFNNSNGFPKDHKKAYKVFKLTIADKKVGVALTELPAGEYAVVVIHDINKDNKMATNWIGMPNEPLGLSNYPEIERPNFDKAKLTMAENQVKEVSITVSDF